MDMLLKDRVDIVIAIEETADHALKFLNQDSHKLQKMNYRHTDKILGYAASIFAIVVGFNIFDDFC